MHMPSKSNDRRRTLGIPLISLVLIVSFAFIPVRCDASDAPHSIFVSPNMLAMKNTGSHQHHSSSTEVRERTVPGHNPAMAVTGLDHTTDRSASNPGWLANGSDPESQHPLGAAFALPTTSVTPGSTNLLSLEGQRRPLLVPVALALDGMTVPPEAPPPRAS